MGYRIYENDEQDPIADDSMEVLWHGDRGQWSHNYACAISHFGPPDFGPLSVRAYFAILSEFHLEDFAYRLPKEFIRRQSPEELKALRATLFREKIASIQGEMDALYARIGEIHRQSEVYPGGTESQVQQEIDALWTEILFKMKLIDRLRYLMG